METKDFVLGFAAGKAQGGGGDEPTGTVEITNNGNHNVKRYATAAVNVPNSYAISDEGKVVNNGTLVAQTARATINENGTYDTKLNNEVTVNVSGGGVEPDLPNEYQRVEYLDFTPSVGILVTIPTDKYILYEADIISDKGSESDAFGFRLYSSDGADFELGITDSGEIGGYVRSSSYGIPLNTGEYTIGDRVRPKIMLNTPRSTALIGKYAYYSSSGVDGLAFDGKLYSIKGTDCDTGDIVVWFVPCYRKADNQVGVYDHIAHAFYYETYAVGSGYSIIAGPDAN